jgi:hypothetical protein
MRQAALKIAHRNAAEVIADIVEEVARATPRS